MLPGLMSLNFNFDIQTAGECQNNIKVRVIVPWHILGSKTKYIHWRVQCIRIASTYTTGKHIPVDHLGHFMDKDICIMDVMQLYEACRST